MINVLNTVRIFHTFLRYVWPDNSTYRGSFVDNRLVGMGEFVDKTGQVWVGKFNNKTAEGLKFKLDM